MTNIIRKPSALFVVSLLILVSFLTVSICGKNLDDDFSRNYKNSAIDIDDEINAIINGAKIPSLSTCIIKNKSIVWYNGYGKYNKFLRLEPTKNTVYMAGSVSKAFTATAIMQLHEDGYFDLDEDVSNYLPFILRNPLYPSVPITFKMLLSHRSSLSVTPLKDLVSFGIVYLFSHKNFPYPALEWHLIPGGKMYRSDVWTDKKPGEAFNYSNTGYLILEYLVEQISEESFDDYCKNNIFNPLNMKNSSFCFRDIKRIQRAVPYLLKGNFHIRLPFYDVPKSGAGGLFTSVEDLSHFLIAHMNNGTYNNTRILDNSSVELMHTLYSKNTNSGVLNYTYGLGWMFFNISGMIYQGHDGDTPGFTARMVYCEKNETGIIFFFNRNRSSEEDINLCDKLVEILCEKSEEF